MLTIQPYHYQAIDVPQSQTFRAPSAEDYELLAQDKILDLKPRTKREPRPKNKQQLGEKRDHQPLHYHTPIGPSPG